MPKNTFHAFVLYFNCAYNSEHFDYTYAGETKDLSLEAVSCHVNPHALSLSIFHSPGAATTSLALSCADFNALASLIKEYNALPDQVHSGQGQR